MRDLHQERKGGQGVSLPFYPRKGHADRMGHPTFGLEFTGPRPVRAGFFVVREERGAQAFLLFRFGERQRGGVDAVTQAGGVGAVGEDMTQVAAAAGAGDLDAPHAVAQVFMLLDGL